MSKKVSVVFGGSSGMGYAIVHELGKFGPVVLVDINEKTLEAASVQLNKLGIENFPITCDISDIGSVQAVADFAVTKGEIANVVNSAGISQNTPGSTERKILEINASGTVNAVKAFYPLISEGGVQINLSSMGQYSSLGPFPTPDRIAVYKTWNEPDFVDNLIKILPSDNQSASMNKAYTMSKEFVTWFSKANVVRYGNKGLRIISVSPGTYDTTMHQDTIKNMPDIVPKLLAGIPVEHRWGHPYEMAALVSFLCSKDAGYISGVDILADGGCTAARALLKDDQITD